MSDDEDGSRVLDRVRERQERREARDAERAERDLHQFEREYREKPDLLGLRFDSERPLAQRYGVSLIDRDQAEKWERLKDDVDALADRAAALAERYAARDYRQREPAGDGLQFSVGPVLGVGPTVSLDGKNDTGAAILLGLPGRFATFTPEVSFGEQTSPTGKKELFVAADVGVNAPFGLARAAVGVKMNMDRRAGSAVYVQTRVLGITATADLSGDEATSLWDTFTTTGQEWVNDGLNRLGMPGH